MRAARQLDQPVELVAPPCGRCDSGGGHEQGRPDYRRGVQAISILSCSSGGNAKRAPSASWAGLFIAREMRRGTRYHDEGESSDEATISDQIASGE